MSHGEFLGYVGPAEIHDAELVDVENSGERLTVRLRCHDGSALSLLFEGVARTGSNDPRGMILYSLSELRGAPPVRCFVFTNADDESPGWELWATNFSIGTPEKCA